MNNRRLRFEPLERRQMLSTVTISPAGETIQAALNAVGAGGTVILDAGTYRQWGIDFTANNQTLEATGAVTISGADVVTGWTSVGGGVYAAPWSHSFSAPSNGSGPAASMPRDQAFLNGVWLPEVTSQGALVAGSFCVAGGMIYLDSNPAGATVEATATAGPLLSTDGHSGETISGLAFTACANGPQGSAAAVQAEGGSGDVLRSDTIQYAAGAGLGVYSTSWVQVLNCTMSRNGQEGFNAANTSTVLFDGVTLASNNTFVGKQYSTNWEAGGGKATQSTGDTFIGVTSTGNVGPGLWLDIACVNTIIADGVFDNNGIGVLSEISYATWIYSNQVVGNTYANDQVGGVKQYGEGVGIYLSSSAYDLVFDNTITGNNDSGIWSIGSVRSDQNVGFSVYSYGSVLTNNDIAGNATIPDPISGGQSEYLLLNVGGNTDTTGVANLNPAYPYRETVDDFSSKSLQVQAGTMDIVSSAQIATNSGLVVGNSGEVDFAPVEIGR